jgi:polyisoprenoid-binding protein YceI
MRTTLPTTFLTAALTFAALNFATWPALGAEQRLILDPERTEVSFDVGATGHDVHGLVALEAGEVTFDLATGDAGGAIVLDAARAKTGNGSRDRTLRGEVFEVERFPTIEFMPAKISGALAAEGSSQLTLHGVLRLHGDPHPLALPATVVVHGSHVTAEATFTVPYLDWGLHDPSVLFLKVARVVSVTVRADGELATAPAAAAEPAR